MPLPPAARRRLRLSLALALAALGSWCAPGAARADTTGSISGRVTDEGTGKPLPAVSVVVSGPQGESTEFTDGNGRYLISDLAPGDYVVRFYFANVKVERPGVHVEADKTLSVNATVPTRSAKEVRVVIKERAPTVDVATSQVQTTISDELVKTTPVGQSGSAGRSYQSVLTLAPGSTTDTSGGTGTPVFSGATGPENQFLIDGFNTTKPSTGLIGTQLSLEFIKETEIIVGGYNAEYGRATGGVVNVVTKSGSNEWHGSIFGTLTPMTLEPPRIGRPGEAIARIQRDNYRAYDFGFDLGGPIVKNRLFFYVGFAPSFATSTYDRILQARSHGDFDVNKGTGDYQGDIDTSIKCPAYIASTNPALCSASSATAYKTTDLDSRFWRHYETNTRNYTGIAKLTLRIDDNNSINLTYLPSVSLVDGTSPGRFNGNPDSGLYAYTSPSQTHDLILRYSGRVLDRKLQLDVNLGWHYEHSETNPTPLGANSSFITDNRSQSVATYEKEVEPCKVVNLGTDNNVRNFNPCPVTGYRDGGLGGIDRTTNQRVAASFGATYFLKALGTHAIKLGGDFEYNWYQHYRAYTGNYVYSWFSDGTLQRQAYAVSDPTDPAGRRVLVYDGTEGNPIGFIATTTTLNEGLYLRDSWSFSFLPGFTLNLGVRWEGQQVNDVNGVTQIGIYDNWAPRVGFVWDFLNNGRSKLYANYGRYFESIPLNINDRQFSGEGSVVQNLSPDQQGTCQSVNGRIDPSTCKFPRPTRDDLLAGTYGAVSKTLQGQYSNEIVAGLQYDVGYDVVLGASYVHRDLGRIIEDISPDGGKTFVIGNPGSPADPGAIAKLQGEVDAATAAATARPGDASAVKRLLDASNQLAIYKEAAKFPKPVRDYNAMVLTATKRFSHNFILNASYTYSRTIGNYPGLFQASNGQLDPNISTQYDLRELLVNRYGPLPSDRPHNFKVTGAYRQPLGRFGELTLGASFFAVSGTPIEVLGRHPTYGPNETFILPRGSGGRTPTVTQLDLRLSYGIPIARVYKIEAWVDVFNVLNQQAVTQVDQAYTNDPVSPILVDKGGGYDQLKYLRTATGGVPALNPNYGQPTAYQAPLSFRVGARISF